MLIKDVNIFVSGKKGYSYLNNKRWTDITREERFFCLVAYNEFCKNINDTVKWLNNQCELGLNNVIIENEAWELGFEVALYRDYIHDEGAGFKNEEDRFRKRTFDLCFFSERYIIIIEAKAYSRFDKKQLEVFKVDKRDIQNRILKKGGSNPEVKFVALISNHYSPSAESIRGIFDGKILTWKDLFGKYKNPIFERADEVYPHSMRNCEVCKKINNHE